jgi:mitotic spindle assembly checkpoint protein MAD2B
MFDVSNFPSVPVSEIRTTFADARRPLQESEGARDAGLSSREMPLGKDISLVDLEEQFRGVMKKLAFCGERLGKLPDGCSFTVCIELLDKAEPPIGVSFTLSIPL